jgi:aspartyl-tRNA(Asn)/glutamyl-tRNA(Gln) amidotransferase subunit A
MYLTDIMTVAVNLAGVPAISIPAGKAAGLPVGLQLIAGQDKDHELLSAAKYVEEIIK